LEEYPNCQKHIPSLSIYDAIIEVLDQQLKAEAAPGVVYMFSTADLSAPVSVAPPNDQALSSSTQTNPERKITYPLSYF